MTDGGSALTVTPWCSIICLLALGIACGGPRSIEEPGGGAVTAVFTGATLLDGTGGDAIADSVLLVEAGRVACVGTPGDCPMPDGAEVVDLSGAWITPGLVDAHVHFAQTAWADGRPDGMDVTDEYPYAAVVAGQKEGVATTYRSYLCSGVTAVFDVGGFPWSWDLRDDASEGLRIGRSAEDSGQGGVEERVASGLLPPHVAAAGPLLTWVEPRMSLPAEQVMVQVTTAGEAEEAVGYVADFGSDAVKVWFVGVPEASRAAIDASVMAAGVAAARRGVPLIVHATSLREAKVAVRAGARLLVHSVSDQPVDDEFLSLARQTGTIYTPTLIVGDNWTSMYESAATGEGPTIDDPNGCVDPETRRKILSTPGYSSHPAVQRLAGEAIAARRARGQRQAEVMADNLRRVRDAGITVAMGTDAGNPFTLHGPSVYDEMEHMQEAGLTAAEILVAATSGGARAMGLDDEIGTLEPGKVADFVVLARDPLADIAAFRSITRVARAGRLMGVADLAFGEGR